MITNEHIAIDSNPYEKVKTFKYLGSLLTNQNYIQEGAIWLGNMVSYIKGGILAKGI